MSLPVTISYTSTQLIGTYSNSVPGSSILVQNPIIGWQFKLALSVTTDLSAVNFTIAGKNSFGASISEVINGLAPGSGILTANEYFGSFTITADAAYVDLTIESSGLAIGLTETAKSSVFTFGNDRNYWGATLEYIGATNIDFTVYTTLQNINGPYPQVASPFTDYPAAANAIITNPGKAYGQVNLPTPIYGLWVDLATIPATSTFTFTILQQGVSR